MRSSARLSPATRQIHDLENRIESSQRYERWARPTQLDFENIVGTDTWSQHWENWLKIQNLMKEAQVLAKQINRSVAEYHRNAL